MGVIAKLKNCNVKTDNRNKKIDIFRSVFCQRLSSPNYIENFKKIPQNTQKDDCMCILKLPEI